MSVRSTVGLIAAGAFVLAACGTPEVTVQNVPGDAEPAPGISVSGTGEVTGTPDTLTMTFGVSVLGDTVAAATAAAADAADALIGTLTAAGVDESDVQTANFSIYPEYDYSEDEQRLRGYRVNNTVTAKIRDIDTAGDVIDAAVAATGDDVVVQGVAFSIEDDEDLIAAARAKAWENARAKAEQLASLSGVTLGAATSISESFSMPPVPIARAQEDLALESATPIEPGEQEVAVTLQVQFAIVP